MNKRLYAIVCVLFVLIFALGGCYSDNYQDKPETTEFLSEQTYTSEKVSESGMLSEPFDTTTITEETTVSEIAQTEITTESTATMPSVVLSTLVPETTTTETETTTVETTAVSPITEKTTTSVSLSKKPSLNEITRSYAYNTLSEKEKQVYDIFEGAAVSLSNRAEFKGMNITKEELQNAVYAFDLYEPVYSYVSLKDCVVHSRGGYIDYVEMAYYYDKSTHQKMTEATERAAQDIFAKITPDMSEYDVVKLFHDEIVKKCVYDESAQNRSFAYGALVDGRATCSGYSKAFSYLCNKAGIENTCAFGNAGGEGHMWNMVRLDGEWYELDTTWDDTSSDGFENFIYYGYFLVTTADMSDRQLFDYNYDKPVATGIKYNYYNMTKTYAEDEKTLEEATYNCLRDTILKNEKYAQFKYKDRNILAKFKEYAETGRMFRILSEVEKDTRHSVNKNEVYFYTSNNDTIVIISL